jgi:hypothetical protein
MHTREYTTREVQPDTGIEKIFVVGLLGQVHLGKNNIGVTYGAPPTVQDMLSSLNNKQKSALDYTRRPSHVTWKRMTRIAEELPGSKMGQLLNIWVKFVYSKEVRSAGYFNV